MENFHSFNLNRTIIQNLNKMNIFKPTPIQIQAIKPALDGKDILGSANTGTGKTAAFGIPIVQKIFNVKSSNALILTPTRELAIQILKTLNELIGFNKLIKTSLVIGGDSMSKQINQIKLKPRIIVGTPGRINDHLQRKTLKLSFTNFLVLDETDRMLDMGFSIQIEKIMKFLPYKRQTLLFSATIPKNIKLISKKYLHKPVYISVDDSSSILKNIKHNVIFLEQKEKFKILNDQLKTRNGSIIIFMKTKHSSKKMSNKLENEGFKTNTIHGDLKQNQREIVISKFRNKKFRILVATDIASRGLDIYHIEHVINYDLPQKANDYIHRIGRTARAGLKGEAVCFVTKSDKKIWKEIDEIINDRKIKDELKFKDKEKKIFKTKKKLFRTKKNSQNTKNLNNVSDKKKKDNTRRRKNIKKKIFSKRIFKK